MWPRYTAVTTLAVVSLVLGTAITWMLTAILIRPLPAAAMLVGMLYGSAYLLFAVASLVEGTPASEYLRATIVTLAAVPLLLTIAASGLERREL